MGSRKGKKRGFYNKIKNNVPKIQTNISTDMEKNKDSTPDYIDKTNKDIGDSTNNGVNSSHPSGDNGNTNSDIDDNRSKNDSEKMKNEIFSDINEVLSVEMKEEPEEEQEQEEEEEETELTGDEKEAKRQEELKKVDLLFWFHNGVTAPFFAKKRNEDIDKYLFKQEEKNMLDSVRPIGSSLNPGWTAYILTWLGLTISKVFKRKEKTEKDGLKK